MPYLDVSVTEDHSACLNAINCSGQNVPENLTIALGQAEINMYMCSNRQGKNEFSCFHLTKNTECEKTVNVLTFKQLVCTTGVTAGPADSAMPIQSNPIKSNLYCKNTADSCGGLWGLKLWH